MAPIPDPSLAAPAPAAAAGWFEPASVAPPPSWLRSLRRPLVLAALGWLLALGLALWLWLGHAMQTVLDEALSQHAAALAQVLPGQGDAALEAGAAPAGSAASASGPVPSAVGQRAAAAEPQPVVWQWMAADGRVLRHSAQAPTQALAPAGAAALLRGNAAGPGPGGVVAGLPSWRVWAKALPSGGQLLVAEREGARAQAVGRITALTSVLALLVSLPALGWLAWQWRSRLQPVADLGAALQAYEPLDAQRALPAPAWAEWAPAHRAALALGARVRRAAHNERAYVDHSAALLTAPLAGLEQHLAAAQREAPALMQARLAQLRAEWARLGHGVAALQGLFHGGGELHLQPVDVAALLARMPVPGVWVQVQGSRLECADANLVAAALMALIDNAKRRRASTVTLTVQASQLQLHDDGPRPGEERLAQLRQTAAEGLAERGPQADSAAALAAVSATTLERYAHHRGGDERPAPGRDEVAEDLALALAHRVAKAHGGRLVLPETTLGLTVQLQLPSLAV